MDLYSVRHSLSLGIPLSNIKLRVTNYSRVSTDDIKQKNSLKNQTNYFHEMIKKNKNWTYIKGYVDDGITGTSDIKRDNFMKMIEDAKNGKFDLIITKEISRFSRNTLDSIRYTRELLQNGVAVLFVNDNINTILPDSELRLTIMASMAQDEIRRLSERVKFGMNRAIIDGHILGNNRLYGYRKNKLNECLEIDIIESEIIKKIYDMYVIEDKSLTKIVKFLNDSNIKTSMNNKFSVATLSRMLKNPKYKGFYCGKKTEVIDYMTKKVKYFDKKDWIMYEDNLKIPPIISKEMWDRAFEKLQKRSKKISKEPKEKIVYQKKYPLSAKLICAEHNNIFYRRKLSKTSNEIAWWCSQYLEQGKHTCSAPSIRQTEIYFIFDDILNNLSINLIQVIDILFKLYITQKKDLKITEQIKKYNEIYKKIEIKKDKLLDLNITGVLSNNEFKEKNDKYNIQISEIKEKISTITNTKNNFENVTQNKEKLKAVLTEKLLLNITKERLIELLLNKIIVSTINNNKNIIELKIFFNFSLEFLQKELKIKLDSSNSFFSKTYEFDRGYNKISTKRYTVKYKINCYI